MPRFKKLTAIPTQCELSPALFQLGDIIGRGEAARYCGVSDRTLSRLCEDGRGPPVVQLSKRRIGFFRRDLIAWLESRRVNGKLKTPPDRSSGP